MMNSYEHTTLVRIYEAAKSFVAVGNNVALTDITVYMADEGVSGLRGLQVDNAYATAQSLERAGLIWIESPGNAIGVRLTRAGVREAEGDA